MEVSSLSGHNDLSMLKRYTYINPSTLLAKLCCPLCSISQTFCRWST